MYRRNLLPELHINLRALQRIPAELPHLQHLPVSQPVQLHLLRGRLPGQLQPAVRTVLQLHPPLLGLRQHLPLPRLRQHNGLP
jgi:hypothetical protein